MNIWGELGIARTDDLRTIKKAYALRLKAVNPEDDPEGFQRLRQSYEQAVHYARWRAQATAIDQIEAAGPAVDEEIVQGYPDAAQTEAPQVKDPAASSPDTPVHSNPAPNGGQRRRQEPQLGAVVQQREQVESANPISSLDGMPVAPARSSRTPSSDLEELIGLLKGSPSFAYGRVVADFMRQPHLQSLQDKAIFERACLIHLLQVGAPYLPFYAAFDEYFHLQERARQVSQSRDDGLVKEFVAAYHAYHWVNELTKKDPHNRKTTRQAALRLLTGKPDEKAFKKFARWQGNAQAMRDLLLELQMQRPEVLHFCVQRESYHWWRDHLAKHELTITGMVGLFLLGLFGSTPLMGLLVDPSSEHRRELALAVLVSSIVGVFAISAVVRKWRRGINPEEIPGFVRWLADVRLHPWARVSVTLVAIAASIASAFVDIHWVPVAAAGTVLACSLFNWGISSTVFIAGFLSWSLRGAIYLLLHPAPGVTVGGALAEAWWAHHLLSIAVTPYVSQGFISLYRAFIRREVGSEAAAVMIIGVALPTGIVGLGHLLLVEGHIGIQAFYLAIGTLVGFFLVVWAKWARMERLIDSMIEGSVRLAEYLRQGWRKPAMVGLTVALIIGSAHADSGTLNLSHACAAASMFMMMFWLGAKKAWMVALLLSVPLHAALAWLVYPLYDIAKDRWDIEPMVLLQHLVVCYLYQGYTLVYAKALSALNKGPASTDAGKDAFYFSFFILLIVGVLMMVSGQNIFAGNIPKEVPRSMQSSDSTTNRRMAALEGRNIRQISAAEASVRIRNMMKMMENRCEQLIKVNLSSKPAIDCARHLQALARNEVERFGPYWPYDPEILYRTAAEHWPQNQEEVIKAHRKCMVWEDGSSIEDGYLCDDWTKYATETFKSPVVAGTYGSPSRQLSEEEIRNWASTVQARVKSNWSMRQVVTGRPSVKVAITLLPSGKLARIRIAEPSGNEDYDQSVETAIRNTDPFPPMPDPRLAGEGKEIMFNFEAPGQ